MASTIGIKIANGEFYSIVGENAHDKKRLLLTTVHDRPKSAQINLYKSSTQTMTDAFFIGSLVLEDIKPQPKGKPSIELVISSSGNGDLDASAVELGLAGKTGIQTLNVSLKNLDYEMPGFELEDDELDVTNVYGAAKYIYTDDTKRGFPWLLLCCVALIIIAVGFLLWFFVFRDENTIAGNVPDQQTQAQPATQAPISPPAVPTPPPVIQAPAVAPVSSVPLRRERIAPPVVSYNVPSVIPREGVPYMIRYGDTLWDIAEAFYRNPMFYQHIARFNNISNPDFISAGTTIRVPPRN